MKRLFHLAIAVSALLLPGCISCNLGAKLDSIGKAVPTIHHNNPLLYELNGNYYTECEVRYMRYTPNMMDWYSDPVRWGNRAEYEEAPSYLNTPKPERYLLKLDEMSPELVKTSDFDFRKARRIKSEELPKGVKNKIPAPICTGWHFLSADMLKVIGEPRELAILPEYRTFGNYLRTPLVAAVSWGVDVPASLAASMLSLCVAIPCAYISIYVCGESFY